MIFAKNINIVPLAITMILMVSIAGCNDIQIDSRWRDRDIYIDGMQFDWESALVNIDDAKLNLGIVNDEEYLYACLVPLDENIIRQALMTGFTVWLETKGDKDNKLGIRHPTGIKGMGFPMRGQNRGQDPEERRKVMEETLREIQIIKPNSDDTISLPVENLSGVEVRVGTRNERMVYELQIPLEVSESHPYAIGATAGNEVKVKFETGEFEMPERRRPGGMGDRPEGGIGGPGGGMPRGGGRGGMRPGGRSRPEMPQPLKLNLKVKLASLETVDD